MRAALAILFIALLVSPSLSAGVRKPLLSTVKKLDALRQQKNSWPAIAIEFAFLQIATGNPLDQLTEALTEVVSDLNKKLEQAHASYDRRTQQHNAEVRRLNDAINTAANDIATTTAFVNDVLLPLKSQLEQEIAMLEDQIAGHHTHIEEITTLREQQHEEYLLKIEEHNSAIEAIDLALEVLSQLHSGEASLVQIKKGKAAFDKLTKQLKKHVKQNPNYAITLATIQTAVQGEFANQEAVGKVENLMREFKNNMIESMASEKEKEEQAQADFEADVKATEGRIAQDTTTKEEKQTELGQTEERIEEANNFIEQRNADKNDLQTELDAENTSFDNDTAIYNELVAQFTSELDACQQALDVLENAEIEGYILDRMDQDKVIDTNHGSGVQVGGDTVEFQD